MTLQKNFDIQLSPNINIGSRLSGLRVALVEIVVRIFSDRLELILLDDITLGMCLIRFNWSLEIVSVFSNFLVLLNMRKMSIAISLADISVKRGGGG